MKPCIEHVGGWRSPKGYVRIWFEGRSQQAQRPLAREFGVSQAQVHNIVARKQWA